MFNRKILTVLLLVLVVVSLTASAASASKSVSLNYLKLAANSDPARPQGETTPRAVDSVKIVEAALVKAGFLADNSYAKDGSYGTATIKAYKKWQEYLGSPAKYCDGIPGEKDLTKLGKKYGFTVDTSTDSNSDSIVTQPTTTSSLIEKPLVISNPAKEKNFKISSRKSGDIRWIVIHDIEGSYGSGISEFKKPTKTSAHYVISKDGEITQMVSDKEIAYHAGNYAYNKYSIGIEHEGYADKCEYTREQYIASAKLVKWLCQEYDIPSVHYSGSVAPADPKAGTGIIGHYQVPDEKDPTKGGGNEHHYDPGDCWDWTYYLKTINTDYSS